MNESVNTVRRPRSRSADRTAAAEWARTERSRLGLTQPAMAAALGVHAQAVWDLEHGKWVPSVERLAALRAAWAAWLAVNEQPGEGNAGAVSTAAPPSPRPHRRAAVR